MAEFNDSYFTEFQTVDEIKFNQKCLQLAKEINNNKLTLLSLIGNLQIFLVDQTPANRKIGILILNNIFSSLKTNAITEQEFTVVTNFYCDRLDDHHEVVASVLHGIPKLHNLKKFAENTPTKILLRIFQNISCQQQQQKDRQCIYHIFKTFLSDYTNEIQNMKLDFVHGVITAVDGERDTKNLLFLFNWFPHFFAKTNLQHLTEEAFEVVACYFPVDFKPSLNENKDVTRQVLADALGNCITSFPKFAEFCIPLALEKFESTLEVAQLDSLKLLEKGCINFQISDYMPHLPEIWSLIQQKMYDPNTNFTIKSASMRTLTIILKKLAPAENFKENLTVILETLNKYLIPNVSIFNITSQIILTITESSDTSSSITCTKILPILIQTYNITQELKFKATVLALLIKLAKASTKKDLDEVKTVPLLCIKAASDSDDNLQTIGFNGIAELAELMTVDGRKMVYKILKDKIVVSSKSQTAIESCLLSLTERFTEELIGNVFDALDDQDVTTLPSCLNYLFSLVALTEQSDLQKFIVGVFLNNLSRTEDTAKIAIDAYKQCLINIEFNLGKMDLEAAVMLLSTLFDWTTSQNCIDDDTLISVGWIIKVTVGWLDDDYQRILLSEYYPKIQALCATDAQLRLFIVLMDGFLFRLRQPSGVDCEVVGLIIAVYTNSKEDFVRNVAVQLLANLINKFDDDMPLEEVLSQIEALDGHNFDLLIWVTKALYMRNYVHSEKWTRKIVTVLKNNKSDVNLPPKIGIILNPTSLSKDSYCTIYLLYRQKFFVQMTNLLLENYESEYSLLLALAYMLKFAPKAVILMEFPKISKLIVNFLDVSNNVEALSIVLEYIKDMIQDRNDIMDEQIQLFLPRVLNLLDKDPAMKLRILLLQCIQGYSFYPLHKILLYKTQVLATLRKCVDDKKRVVRKEATEASLLWSLIEANA